MRLDAMSFAIITDGRPERQALLPVILESIRRQGILHTEILLVGKSPVVPAGVQYIPMEREAEAAWVTRLMNAGVEAAQKPLVMMLHDDVVLADDFAVTLDRNSWRWDYLIPKFLYADPPLFRGVPIRQRCLQWPRWTIGGPQGHRQLRDDEPWDPPFSYPSGECLIGWKQAFRLHRWNPDNNHRQTRGSAQAFDVEFGHLANDKGLFTAYDPNVNVWCLEP